MVPVTDPIDRFIQKLAKTRTPPNSLNMFAFDTEANAIRRHNLHLYLGGATLFRQGIKKHFTI